MLASLPASMLNQNPSDLGIPNRIDLKASRSSAHKIAQTTLKIRFELRGGLRCPIYNCVYKGLSLTDRI